MDPPLRETMLVRGDVDAITGFTFTSLLNLNRAASRGGDRPCPIRSTASTSGNAIIVGEPFLKENPER